MRTSITQTAGPGFGKTVLSAHLIEDLQFDPQDGGLGQNVVFFHFDSRRPEKEAVFAAIRALTTQLIHQNQQATEVIDAASLLMDVTGSGQSIASDEEVLEIFALLTHRIMGSVIVLDGIDECNDARGLLLTLYKLLSDVSCKLLLLGRPNVKFPATYLGIQSINPQIYANLEDIKLYLNSEVDDLLTTVTVAGQHSVKKIADMIADRSRSMFLFARLMIEYLNSPALTPLQRLEEIDGLTSLEGLSTMYGRVVKTLMNRYANEKDVVKMTFQLLAAAKRPLKVDEIRTALSLKVGQTTSLDPMDKIENLEFAVIDMCGALVEVTGEGELQFIHASVKEFLIHEAQRDLSGTFYIDMTKAHLMVARLCLSYLVYDMSPGPLSGYAEETTDPELLQARLPLLCYAVTSWAHHLAYGMKYGEDRSLPEMTRDFPDLAKLFSQFLLSKPRVTAWIEASWTYGSNPNITDSLKVLSSLDERQNHAEETSSNLVLICKELENLSRDLTQLTADWAHLLSERPNEIWGSSVSAFNKSNFWVNTASTIVNCLFDDKDLGQQNIVLRASKPSGDGQEVGLIDVLDGR